MCWPAGGAAGERAAGAGCGGDHRPGPARGLRDLPRAERGARQDLLPRHPAAAARQAAARARALRLRALRRRARRRPRPARPGGPGQLGRRVPRRPRRAATARDPVSRAAIHTARTWDIPRDTFEAFLASDARWTSPSPATRPTPTSSTTCTARPPSSACRWCRSSSRCDPHAAGYAQTLGEAFQLSNFIRDVAEDLRRGRVYLPQEDLDAVRRHPRRPRARPDAAAGPRAARLRDRPHPRALPRRRARHRPAAPDEPRLHPHRVRALPRHPRRGREGRLPGAGPPGRACRSPRRLRVAVPGLVRARRARGARAAEPPPPPHPPRQRLHAPARSRTAGPPPARRPAARPRIAVVVVRHDVAPGEPAVGQQLEEQRRSRTPSRTTRRVTSRVRSTHEVEQQRDATTPSTASAV